MLPVKKNLEMIFTNYLPLRTRNIADLGICIGKKLMVNSKLMLIMMRKNIMESMSIGIRYHFTI